MQLPRCWQKNVEGLSGTIYIYAASSRISLSTVKAILQDMVYIGVRLKGDTMNQPVGIVGRHPASLILRGKQEEQQQIECIEISYICSNSSSTNSVAAVRIRALKDTLCEKHATPTLLVDT